MGAKAGPLRRQRAFLCVRKKAQYRPISNKCMKTSHRAGSFRGIWGEKPAKKPPSSEGGVICEANDGGRDWAEGACPRPTWCVISWRLTARQAQGQGAPGSSRPTQGYVVLLAPSSGPSGHLPPRGKVRRVREAAPYMVCVIRRGRCPHRPAGGHTGPPLRKFRTVVVRRGGPACPPSRSGRTHRCAPTRITNALHGAYSVGPDDPAGRGAPSGRALRWCVFP